MKFRLKDKWYLISAFIVFWVGIIFVFIVSKIFQAKDFFIRSKSLWYFAVFIFAAMILLITILLI
ncbi:hypothetical protein KJ863_02925 [Patescibacteria group bacterium]|nr:hypothetical protein [Candidatus Falkowbacteria bacterium]MBU3906575.1 hypothetical protein [Patescibacteria group bacterium]MBU4014616.1 hypothetical protein [Patescibacteria group bacterium]MBU4073050.1 hypothetical protein [Patescibacteria group bacterium]MBU4125478.1 hypothetical protein [Patescibacteria group bacterium]